MVACLGDLGHCAPGRRRDGRLAVPAAPASKLDWKGCGGNNQCAKLTVPLDYDHPDNGKTFKWRCCACGVRPTRRSASAPCSSTRAAPALRASSSHGNSRAFLPDEIKARFDIVGFDPRGSGATAPVKCEDNLDGVFSADYSPDTPASVLDLDTRSLQQLAQSCEARSGNLLPYV